MFLTPSQMVEELDNVDEVLSGIAYQLDNPKYRKMDEDSLKYYLTTWLRKKEERDQIREHVQGIAGKDLDFKICHRVWLLEKLMDHVQKGNGYSHMMPSNKHHIPTMQSIYHAYISRALQIYDVRIVTYWARGQQLTGPVRYNVTHYNELYQTYGVELWMEGETQVQSTVEFEMHLARFFPYNWEQVYKPNST